MSMCTHVAGFRLPDEMWKKMKAVWDACKTAGVSPPKAVEDFFNYKYPSDNTGIEVNLVDLPCITEYNNDMQNGYEVDLDKLPVGIKIIRFYNSY